MKNNVTPQMLKAIGHYAEHGIKVAAYRHAYDVGNMSNRSVHRATAELFNHPAMKTMIATMKKQAFERAVVNRSWVLQRLVLLADFNINKFIITDDRGNAVYDFSNATDDDWYCISEYTIEELHRGTNDDRYLVEKIKIKPFDRIKALKMIGDHDDVQAFKTRVEIEGGLLVADVTVDEYAEARKKILADDDI